MAARPTLQPLAPAGPVGPVPHNFSRDAYLEFQRSVDFFRAYWTSPGALFSWRGEEAAGRRAPIYRTYRLPWPVVNRPFPRTPSGKRLGANPQGKGFPPIDPGTANQFKAEVERGEYGVINLTKPLAMDLKKILGKGGQGVACLFERTETDGSKVPVVVKASVSFKDVANEVGHLRSMAGANHIIQRLYGRELIPRMPAPPPDPDINSDGRNASPNDKGRKRTAGDAGQTGNQSPKRPKIDANAPAAFDASNRVFAMEFMKHGDVRSAMAKFSSMKLSLPQPPNGLTYKDQDLWDIFHCLFRGVVALAYRNAYDGGRDPATQDIPQMFELIPRPNGGEPGDTKEGIVHFDIDAMNVMLGDYDARHSRVPIVKIGDLGCGRVFTAQHRQDFQVMLSHRRQGKELMYTPEQNTMDWNYMDTAPVLRDEDIAGNFDWHTNLYQAAHVMWQIISGCRPNLPPESVTMLFNPAGTGALSIWTYGGMILDDNQYGRHDSNLRETIAWCMAVNPRDRPSMTTLEATFIQMCQDSTWAFPASEIARQDKVNFKDIMEFVPPPPAAVPMAAPNMGLPWPGPFAGGARYPVRKEEVWAFPRWLVMTCAVLVQWLVWAVTLGRKNVLVTPKVVRLITMDRTFCIDKIKDRLGYRPRFSTKEGLQRAVGWYMREVHGSKARVQ